MSLGSREAVPEHQPLGHATAIPQQDRAGGADLARLGVTGQMDTICRTQ